MPPRFAVGERVVFSRNILWRLGRECGMTVSRLRESLLGWLRPGRVAKVLPQADGGYRYCVTWYRDEGPFPSEYEEHDLEPPKE